MRRRQLKWLRARLKQLSAMTLTRTTQPEPELELLLDKLKLQLPAPPPSKISADQATSATAL